MQVRSPRAVAIGLLVLWLIAAAASTYVASGWTTDNRLARWAEQLPTDEGWDVLCERFGGDESVLVRIDGFDEGDTTVEAWLTGLGPELSKLAAVDGAADPLHLPGMPTGGGVPWEALRERPIVRTLDLVHSSEARLDFVLLVRLDATPEERAALAGRLLELSDEAASLGARLRAAGHPLIAAALDVEALRVERVFVPALVLLSALVVAIFLRSIALAALALLPAIVASSGTRAVLHGLGHKSDLILVTLGPVIFVVMLASALHLLVCFRDHRACGAPCPEAASAARHEKWVASALAALTTAVGFGAFALSDLSSVAELGVSVSIAVLVGVGLCLAFLPPVLAGLPFTVRHRTASRSCGTVWRRIALAARRRRGIVIAVGLTLIPLGTWAATGLETETNALHYFPDGHPARRQFMDLEAEGCSLSSVEVLVRRVDGAAWTTGSLENLGLGERLGAVEGTTAVFGPRDVLADARSLGVLALLGAPEALLQARRLDEGATWARWTVRFPTADADVTRDMVQRVKRAAEASGDQSLGQVLVAGSVPRMLDMQSTLLGTLIYSLGLTLLAVALLFAFAVQSPRELVVAFLVNILPVASVLGVASLCGVPLDGATVMVAAVVLGLAVDNTFHLLHAARDCGTGMRARLRAFDRVGTAATISSLALAMGFASLGLSGFAPTARFGLLCATGAVGALVSNLLFLPALWVGSVRSAES